MLNIEPFPSCAHLPSHILIYSFGKLFLYAMMILIKSFEKKNSSPERATMSLNESPTFWNLATNVGTVEFGPGMLLVAAALLAPKLSFLPIWTSQLGPPDCKFPISYSNITVKVRIRWRKGNISFGWFVGRI